MLTCAHSDDSYKGRYGAGGPSHWDNCTFSQRSTPHRTVQSTTSGAVVSCRTALHYPIIRMQLHLNAIATPFLNRWHAAVLNSDDSVCTDLLSFVWGSFFFFPGRHVDKSRTFHIPKWYSAHAVQAVQVPTRLPKPPVHIWAAYLRYRNRAINCNGGPCMG